MNPPKIPIHIGDFLRDTGHLRALGIGAYSLLLFHHWSTGSLPDDDEQLMVIARLTKAEWVKLRPTLAKFFGEGWRHRRVEKDLAEAKESYEKRAAAGSEGGKAKARKKQSQSNATAMLDLPASNALPTTYHLPDKKEDAPDGAPSSGKAYAFESGAIRLNERDLELWKASFVHLDVAAELLAMTAWAGEQRSWFNAVKGALAKKNQQAKERKEAAAKQGDFQWKSGIEGVI